MMILFSFSGLSVCSDLYSYCENNSIMNVDYTGYRSVILYADWFGFALDIAFTVISSWIKIGYDIIGSGLRWYAQRKGFTLFYEKLLYGVVPKIKGVFGKWLTLLRKAIWRFAGNVCGNMTSGFLSTALSKFLSSFLILIKKSGAAKVMKIVCRLLTLGSVIALILDWITDGDPFNNIIRFN